ncbi:unnamed protein product [Durusdinium trenchii]|uniref:peptidylprolyl isomerase n=1 Tax=Durusdinium trenchii TaxID=1381693 RepID=A0ABP0J465_9DINO
MRIVPWCFANVYPVLDLKVPATPLLPNPGVGISMTACIAGIAAQSVVFTARRCKTNRRRLAASKLRPLIGASAISGEAQRESSLIPKKYLLLETDLGNVAMLLRPDSAPLTVEHVCRLVDEGLYNGCYFYRSDFVLQWGLWLPNETEVKNPYPDIAANETDSGTFLSNRPGTVAIAHGIGVNGNSDIFINLQDNDYLDTMSLGFCVFAELDAKSRRVVKDLAEAVVNGLKPVIWQASIESQLQKKEKLLEAPVYWCFLHLFPLAVSMQRSYDSFCSQWEDFKSVLVVKPKDENG